MGSLQADDDDKKELDDSGYVQDADGPGPHKSSPENGKHVHLLDLSDDVLLCILSHCRPSDLKALGFTCTRLASLVRDRTLWQRVDARDAPCGRRRLRWLLAHALHAGTTQLMIKGFAWENAGCQGYVNRLRKEVEAKSGDHADIPGACQQLPRTWPRDYQFYPLPRASISPSWPADEPARGSPAASCPGPVFTLTPCLLRQIRSQCNLTRLALEYCNINCNNISLAHFPPRLTYLSFRGAKCFNMPLDKSFLFKIQDYLPDLEHLDLSECTWLDPSCLLPLSKLLSLRKLYMSSCPRMTEFVAYASLAARYGFRKLQVFDLRGSPLGDSEATALGWLPDLEELYLSAIDPCAATHHKHEHYRDDVLPKAEELSEWELQEPEYFKSLIKQNKHIQDKGTLDERCFHGLPFNHCLDGYRDKGTKKCARDLKRSAMNILEEPGPSKRKRSPGGCESGDDDEDMNEETNGEDEDMNEDGEKTEETAKDLNSEAGGKVEKNKDKLNEINNVEGSVEANGEVNNENANGEAMNTAENSEVVNNPENGEASNNTENGEVVNNANNGEASGQANVNNEVANIEEDNNEEANGEEGNNEEANGEEENENQNVIEVRPRAHVLYVNVGHQLHPVYRLAIPNEPGANEIRRWHPNAMMQFTHPSPSNHNLITDSAIRSFGHSDDDNVNYFHIGGLPNAPNSRPNKSNLRILSVVGYKNITDRSLVHLRSSAPKLEVIDFSRTSVTEKGVEMFKISRPDVEVKFSRFVEPEPLDCRVHGDAESE